MNIHAMYPSGVCEFGRVATGVCADFCFVKRSTVLICLTRYLVFVTLVQKGWPARYDVCEIWNIAEGIQNYPDK